MKIKVYHDASEIIDNPICTLGRDNIGFGKGFYITDVKD